MRSVLTAGVLSLIMTLAACGAIWTVDPGGTGDFPTIQAAIDACQSGDVIELTDGVFSGPGNRDLDTAGKALTIRSQNGDPELCVLLPTAGAPAEDHIGFRIENDEGPDTMIEGVTIQGAQGGYGGACYIFDASPSFVRCRFLSNEAAYGGAATIYFHAAPSFVDCRFEDNTGFEGGGAIYCYYNTAATFERCAFIGNKAWALGGAVFAQEGDAPVFQSCTFDLNHAFQGYWEGFGFWFDQGSVAEMSHCIVSRTFAGGGIAAFSGSAVLTCCDLWDNQGGDFVGPLAGQGGQNGNFSADPIYCDPAAGNYTIDALSPCSPLQNPECGLIGCYDVGCGTMSAEGRSPMDMRLALRMPSPIRVGTDATIRFTLPDRAMVRFVIHDLQGRVLCHLLEGTLPAGEHEAAWDGSADHGAPLSPGIYFCRLQSDGRTVTRNLVVLD